jgi:hypothetical protein
MALWLSTATCCQPLLVHRLPSLMLLPWVEFYPDSAKVRVFLVSGRNMPANFVFVVFH